MKTVVDVSRDTVISLAALAGLLAIASGREPLVVATAAAMPTSRLAALALGLAPHRMATIIVDGHVVAADRALIEEILDDCAVPVILTTCDPPPVNLTSWLDRTRYAGRPSWRPSVAVPRC